MAHRRAGRRIGRLHLVAMHERHDRHRLAVVTVVPADDERLVMGVVAVRVPPRSMERPRRERRRPGVGGSQAVPGLARDRIEGPRLDVQPRTPSGIEFGKALEGLGLVVVLVGLLGSVRLGMGEQGLESMRFESYGLLAGGALFLLGLVLERSAGRR